MDLRLRAATEADLPRLTALARAAYERYVERIGGPPRPMVDDYAEVVREGAVVAERGDDVVGLLVLRTIDGTFFLDNVAVDPAHHGTGVGRALLEHAEGEARAAGHEEIHLYTHETMVENQALYGRIGYVEYARQPVDTGSVVLMRKRLG